MGFILYVIAVFSIFFGVVYGIVMLAAWAMGLFDSPEPITNAAYY